MIPIRDVRSVLYATAILFGVAVIGLRGVFVWLEYRSAVERAEAATQDLALLLEEYTKRTLETSDLLLRDMIAYVQAKGGVEAIREAREAHEHLVELTRESSTSDLFLIVDRHGIPVAMSNAELPARIDFSDQTWFKSHRAGAETFVDGPLVGRLGDEIFYTYTRRISDAAGEFSGVAQVAIRPAFLQNLSRPDVGTENLLLGIWGRDGRVIARTGLTKDNVGMGLGQSRLFNEFATRRSGTYWSDITADGARRIVSFRRLERWPLTVTASIPVATALAAWISGLIWSAIVTTVVLVALAWLTWFGVRLSYRTEEAQRELQDVNQELAQTNQSLEQALADKIVLLQEIHHRVKNNLQVTSSLLQMQSRRFADPNVKAAFQETQDRLRSIGLIHDTLYRNETGGTVDLSDYLRRLLDELSATYGALARGIAVDLDAEPIAIDLDRAAPLALTVTEAVSNAFKHAFGPGEGGRIQVTARRIQDRLELTVRDTGRGIGNIRETDSSLGMKLIRAFAGQLGGQFSFETDGGTVFRLSIPC
ncbi:MAG TPA: histidine kinase dimerization/phosphoacceptor domain -containing protein [Microvirga sp.]|nr:histidine kinase dimerization/phosphoacceptor domain -containing protein [Microvirga sp.]